MAIAPDSTICLINFDTDDLVDVTGHSTVVNNGVTINTSYKKFGNSSGYFNKSSSNALSIALSTSGPKTVSFWFYAVGSNTSGWYPTVWSTNSPANYGGIYTHIDDGSYSTYPVYRANSASGNVNNGTYGSTVITRNTWHHFAYCSNATSNYFFLDGVLQATVTQSNPITITDVYLGGLMGSSSLVSGCYFNGYIDDVLICTECLWTSDFDVPTEAWEWSDTTPITVSVSSNYSTYSGSISNIKDGDTSTYWWTSVAQSSGKYILFTFNRPVTFNGLTAVTLNNISDCLKSGNVLQVSSDGSDYTTVGTFTGQTTCTFSNINQTNVKYVRIYVTSSSINWLCINEITLDYTEPVTEIIPVISVGIQSKSIISDETGYNECICEFTSDSDLIQWEARATKSGVTPARGVGLLVEEGTILTANTAGTISVLYTELTDGDGDYVITVYGRSTSGHWSDGSYESL